MEGVRIGHGHASVGWWASWANLGRSKVQFSGSWPLVGIGAGGGSAVGSFLPSVVREDLSPSLSMNRLRLDRPSSGCLCDRGGLCVTVCYG